MNELLQKQKLQAEVAMRQSLTEHIYKFLNVYLITATSNKDSPVAQISQLYRLAGKVPA